MSKIYFLRGKKVMLDRDLAELYGVSTKRLNEQVKRNIHRFPEDFMFLLTQDEVQSLRSQIATSNDGRGGRRTIPFAFTEHGAVMLASVLNSIKAVQTSILVVRAFVKIREILSNQLGLRQKFTELEEKFLLHDKTQKQQFDEVFRAINNLLEAPKPIPVLELIKASENDQIEFKAGFRGPLEPSAVNKEIEYAVLKTLAGFLNSKGGTLLIGIDDSGRVVGIEKGPFPNRDKMLQHLTNQIRSKLGAHAHQYIRISVETIQKKEIIRIDCNRSYDPVYLKHKDGQKFYIRSGSCTNELPVHEVHGYIKTRFEKA
jgi:hypothetical protein